MSPTPAAMEEESSPSPSQPIGSVRQDERQNYRVRHARESALALREAYKPLRPLSDLSPVCRPVREWESACRLEKICPIQSARQFPRRAADREAGQRWDREPRHLAFEPSSILTNLDDSQANQF